MNAFTARQPCQKGVLSKEIGRFEGRSEQLSQPPSASEHVPSLCLNNVAFKYWIGILDGRAAAEKFKSLL
jgi:hypothetical protein